MDRIKERKKRRAQLADRKSIVSQTRMKNIASLADEQPANKKRRKAGAGTFLEIIVTLGLHRSLAEDMFGENDDDWLIYRQVVSPCSILRP